MRRIPFRALLAVLLLAAPGCGVLCDAEEERAVSAFSVGSLTLVREYAGAQQSSVRVEGRLEPRFVGEAAFDAVFGVIARGGAPYDGVVFSLGGTDPSTGELVALSLALPTPLQKGAAFRVGGAFPVALGAGEAERWRKRTLAAADRAEIALHTGRYTFPPPAYHTTFAATAADGTVTVLRRWGGDTVELGLDLTAGDDSGRSVQLRGNVYLNAERYTPSCT